LLKDLLFVDNCLSFKTMLRDEGEGKEKKRDGSVIGLRDKGEGKR
jgi:hypothetical protein